MTDLLKLRNEAKAKKPTFLKQAAHLLPKLKKNWRAPRGRHSKFRTKLRSYRKQPSMGYGSPKEVRGLTHDGHKVIIVSTLKELEGMTDPVTIAGNVGMKKRLALVQACEEKKIQILNVQDIAVFKESVATTLKERKALITKRNEKRAKKAAKKEEKKDDKKDDKKAAKKETTEQPEESKKQVEQEKRKILEKKE